MTKQRWLLIVFYLFIGWLIACGPAPRSRRQNDFEILQQKAAVMDSINCSKNLSTEQRQQAWLELYQHSDIVRFATINKYGYLFVWFEEPYYKKLGNFIDVPECNFYAPKSNSLPQYK